MCLWLLFLGPGVGQIHQTLDIWQQASWYPSVLALFLWLRAPKISKNAFSTETPGPIIPESGIVAAGVFLIGIYWLIRSFSVVVTQLSAQATINYGWCVVLILSVGLILGNNVLAKIFRKLRTAGTNA